MDVRQLRYFACIAQCGSLSAAAERLRIAQPSLSLHMQRIEEELGVQLLVRSPRGVTLTGGGRRLYEHANSIIKLVEAAVADIREHSEEATGPVSFGFPNSAGNVLVVPLVETIRLEFPKIQLRAMEAMSGHVQQWLAEGLIDLGVLYDVNSIRHFHVKPLLSEPLFLVASSDSWDAPIGPNGIAKTPIDLADCATMELILPNRSHGLREMIERLAHAQGVALIVPLELDSLSQIKVLVAKGSGYTILPHAAASQEIMRGTLILVPIRNPIMRRMVYLVTNPERPSSRAAEEVERVIFRVVEELVRKGIWLGQLSDADDVVLG
jgi:LysR family nitrogen assimilation transcriptional regulator